MDDARIRQLTEEVLAQVRGGGAPPGLEERVAALEAAMRELRSSPASSATVVTVTRSEARHPSLELLGPAGGPGRCILEPDKPCVQSGQCRTLGH